MDVLLLDRPADPTGQLCLATHNVDGFSQCVGVAHADIKQQSLLKRNNAICLPGPEPAHTVHCVKTLKERLLAARVAKGMTQAELAAAVKRLHPKARVTQQNIAYLEKGSRRTAYIAEIADALDVHTDWLALGIGPRERSGKTYSTDDPKLIAALKLMQEMPEYQKDQAVKSLMRLRNHRTKTAR